MSSASRKAITSPMLRLSDLRRDFPGHNNFLFLVTVILESRPLRTCKIWRVRSVEESSTTTSSQSLMVWFWTEAIAATIVASALCAGMMIDTLGFFTVTVAPRFLLGLQVAPDMLREPDRRRHRKTRAIGA